MRERREGSVRRDRGRKGKKSGEGGAAGGRCKEKSCWIVLPCVDYVFTPHSCGCVLSADELYKVDKTVVADILVQEHMEGEGSPPAPSGDRKEEAEQEEVKQEEEELENDEHDLKERKVLEQEGEEQEGEEQDAEEKDTSAVESLLQESRSNILVVVKETSRKKGNTCMHIPNSAYVPT